MWKYNSLFSVCVYYLLLPSQMFDFTHLRFFQRFTEDMPGHAASLIHGKHDSNDGSRLAKALEFILRLSSEKGNTGVAYLQ